MEKYVKEYSLRSYECDRNKRLRLVTLMNIFQDIADEHATHMGLGIAYCLEQGFAWVGSNYHIFIEQKPKIHEKIKLMTWPAEAKRLAAIRDFELFGEDGKSLIKAASQWVLINIESKRPLPLLENLPQYETLNENIVAPEFAKLPDLEYVDLETRFKIRFDDIDFNKHVNNSIYPLWASESVPEEWSLKKTISEIEISFKKEGLFGENVKVQTQLMHDEISLHSIRSTIDDRELAKVRIRWTEA